MVPAVVPSVDRLAIHDVVVAEDLQVLPIDAEAIAVALANIPLEPYLAEEGHQVFL